MATHCDYMRNNRTTNKRIMYRNYLKKVFQTIACTFFRKQAWTKVPKGGDFHNRGSSTCGQKHYQNHCPVGQDYSVNSCFCRHCYCYRQSAGSVSLAFGYENIALSGNDNIPCLTGNRQLTRSIPRISLLSMRHDPLRLYIAYTNSQ
jgi:hypothetical protein